MLELLTTVTVSGFLYRYIGQLTVWDIGFLQVNIGLWLTNFS
jgi:hypothetical protein